MINILVIGMMGEGKSEFVKKFIEGNNCIVNDIQDEYGPKPKYPNQQPLNLSSDISKSRCRYIGGDFDEYVKIVSSKKNTICVFEEATVFLEGRIGKNVRKLMVNKLFTKNIYIFLFHSISSVPPRILQLSNLVVLYKTGDEDYQVKQKYPSLYPYFETLKGKPTGSHFKIKR